jgi:hypothetical protein
MTRATAVRPMPTLGTEMAYSRHLISDTFQVMTAMSCIVEAENIMTSGNCKSLMVTLRFMFPPPPEGLSSAFSSSSTTTSAIASSFLPSSFIIIACGSWIVGQGLIGLMPRWCPPSPLRQRQGIAEGNDRRPPP